MSLFLLRVKTSFFNLLKHSMYIILLFFCLYVLSLSNHNFSCKYCTTEIQHQPPWVFYSQRSIEQIDQHKALAISATPKKTSQSILSNFLPSPPQAPFKSKYKKRPPRRNSRNNYLQSTPQKMQSPECKDSFDSLIVPHPPNHDMNSSKKPKEMKKKAEEIEFASVPQNAVRKTPRTPREFVASIA